MPFAATGRSKPHLTTAATSHLARTNHVSVATPACLLVSAASPSTSSSQARPAPSARTATALLWRASITCLKSWPFHSVEQPCCPEFLQGTGGNQLLLDVPNHEAVLPLIGREPDKPFTVAEPNAFHQPPSLVIVASGVADLALPYEIVESP